MKNVFFIVLLAFVAFAIDKPSEEWNSLVTQCAMNCNLVETKIKIIQPDKQIEFAIDVMKAVYAFPNKKETKAELVKFVAVSAVLNSTYGNINDVKTEIVKATPTELVDEIKKAISNLRNDSYPKIAVELQTSGGIEIKDALLADLHSTTNTTISDGYFISPGMPGAMVPQSDIGILRVPRPLPKKNRNAIYPDNTEPLPYFGQQL